MRDAARPTISTLITVLTILVTGAWLRARGIGHLLMWDEAFDACSVRAFAAGGKDYFSSHFWYHPPAFKVLMLLARPLHAGFAERSEALAIIVSTLSAAALFLLNKRIYGNTTALLASAIFALLPGAVFYDAWIKGGCLVQLFGILALLAFAARRYVVCGLMLGLGMLDKETAMFYGLGVGLLWILDGSLRKQWRIPLAIGVAAIAAGAWWYLGFSSTVRFFLSFARGTGANADDWYLPWNYYFVRAASDLGPAGILFSVIGVAACVAAWRAARATEGDAQPGALMRLWPLLILVPVYAALSAMSAKIPWIINSLFAAWATLAAVGLAHVLHFVKARPLAALVIAAALAVMGGTAVSRSHEQEQLDLGLDFWPAANRSRTLAERMNKEVGPDERAFITTFHYLGKDFAKFPCPVFTYYLKDIPVVLRAYDVPADYVEKKIVEQRLDWALLSPEPGDQEKNLVGPLLKHPGVEAHVLDGAYLLRTTAIYSNVPHTP